MEVHISNGSMQLLPFVVVLLGVGVGACRCKRENRDVGWCGVRNLCNADYTNIAMREENIAGHRVEFYDSIEELPIVRYQRFNKMLLVDAGVGGDVSDFDNHLERVLTYLANGKIDLATTELHNLRQNIYFVQENLSPKYLSFAALIKSIDGKPCSDLSDEGLAKTLGRLRNAPVGRLSALLGGSKKKIDEDLLVSFPSHFDNSASKEYFDKLRKRTLLLLDCIISGKTKTKQDSIDMLTLDLLLFSKPQDFASGKVEVEYDKQFEKMCTNLSVQFGLHPKEMTVVEFYSAYEHLNEKIRNKYKRNGKPH